MKKAKKALSMLMAMQIAFLSVFCVGSASEKIIDEDFEQGYVEGQTLTDLKSGSDVVVRGIANGGTFTIGTIPGEKGMGIKSTATVVKNNVLYIFPGQSMLEKTKDFWSISFRMRMEGKENWDIYMKDGKDNKGTAVLQGQGSENVIVPANGSYWSGNEAQKKYWDPNKFFTIKLIFDMKSKTFDYYFDGKLVGNDCKLRDDVEWGTTGAYYMTLTLKGGDSLNPASQENPRINYIDDIMICSYNGDNEMEMYPVPDCFSNDSAYTGADSDMTYVGNIQNAFGKTCLGLDFINRSGISKPLCVAAALYEKDADGYSQLKKVQLKNVSLAAGVTRVLTPIFDLTKNGDGEQYVKVFTWNAIDQLLPYNGFLQLTAE